MIERLTIYNNFNNDSYKDLELLFQPSLNLAVYGLHSLPDNLISNINTPDFRYAICSVVNSDIDILTRFPSYHHLKFDDL
jgi:hypothetical protein